MNKYNLKMVVKPAIVKVKPKPQYDEDGFLLNPTPEQLLDMLHKAEAEYWAKVKAGRKIRNITCLDDILNYKDN